VLCGLALCSSVVYIFFHVLIVLSFNSISGISFL
jgi:hypothetical protein